MSAASTIRFAIALIKERGHATNEVCHEGEGFRGYCVGMAIILGSQAEGRSHAEVRAAMGCSTPIWTEIGVGNALAGIADWREARCFVAWAWGMPRDEDPNTWGDEAAVPPNQYAKEHDLDPVPYLENALAMAEGRPLPHDLAPLPCWPRCEEPGCKRILPDPDGFCTEHNPFGRPAARGMAS